MNQIEEITLATIGSGAAAEKFDDAYKRVLANILDGNTTAEAPREIILSFKFTPNEERSAAGIKINCRVKLADGEAYETTVLCGFIDGQPASREHDSHKAQLEFTTAKPKPTLKLSANGTFKPETKENE